MKWKEHAHLFANGKFKCKVRDFDSIYSIDEIVTFRTYISGCTLIARKIEDMTDEEVVEYNDNWAGHEDTGRNVFIQLAEEGMPLALAVFLGLKGIYFLSQKHFENGTVIDIKTI